MIVNLDPLLVSADIGPSGISQLTDPHACDAQDFDRIADPTELGFGSTNADQLGNFCFRVTVR